MKNSKYVKSWFIELLPNNIYLVLFNLTERWIPYHRYNDTMYTFGEDESDQEVPEFLPNKKGTSYMATQMQEKDQVSFYYIPYNHNWIKKKDKIIFSSK